MFKIISRGQICSRGNVKFQHVESVDAFLRPCMRIRWNNGRSIGCKARIRRSRHPRGSNPVDCSKSAGVEWSRGLEIMNHVENSYQNVTWSRNLETRGKIVLGCLNLRSTQFASFSSHSSLPPQSTLSLKLKVV